MTLAAHLILDTGAIVFSRSVTPGPGQILIGMGHDLPWRRSIFTLARISGATVHVPGYHPDDPEGDRMAALAEFQGALISRRPGHTHPPAAIGSRVPVSLSESRQQVSAGRGG